MDWITKDYVKAEAEKGRKQAIECTRLHWQQLVKAGPKELDKVFKVKVTICSAHCAMCHKYLLSGADMMCPRCLLKCGDVWKEARDALYKWRNNFTRTNWRKWKEAAKAMLAKIDRLYERLYNK